MQLLLCGSDYFLGPETNMVTNEVESGSIAVDLHELYENAPCGYHSVGPDGTILRMNRTELGWLGFTREEFVGSRKFSDIISAGGYREYKHAFVALSAGRDVAELETELARKDGSLFKAFLRIGAVRDCYGVFLHTHATVMDISALKRAETDARIYAEQLQAISQRVVEIQEMERRNISAELHDRLGQDLATINLNLHIVKNQLSAGWRTKVGSRLDDSIALVERTVEVARDVACALRPLALDDYGLSASLKSYSEQFAARTGIRVTVASKQAIPRLQPDAEMALFRVSQEALTNVQKHARAAMVKLTLAVDAKNVCLTIADDGDGFDAESRAEHGTKRLGLLIMEERLRAVEGSLRIESRLGAGTSLIVNVRRQQ